MFHFIVLGLLIFLDELPGNARQAAAFFPNVGLLFANHRQDIVRLLVAAGKRAHIPLKLFDQRFEISP